VAADPSDYVLASSVESERLERQADLHGRDRPLQHISLRPGAAFLDAGCGSGWVARRVGAAFPEANITGIDLTPAYVADARTLARSEGLRNTTFVVGDLMNLPFADATFDVVWSQFVLYFLPDPQQAVREFRRVTKPGGKVVAALHKFPAYIDPDDFPERPQMDAIVDFVIGKCPPETVPRLFANAGLTDIDVVIERDRIYSKLGGPVDAARRRNSEEVLASVPTELRAAADAWLRYLDRPDTNVIVGYWLTKGAAPG
jgi:SAM-dependent methyltransferase